MRAVDAIMECLKAEGADAVFGIPGGANLPTYDALYDAGIRHILCKHEQGAVERLHGALLRGIELAKNRAGPPALSRAGCKRVLHTTFPVYHSLARIVRPVYNALERRGRVCYHRKSCKNR